ncbi:uncharacterized protein LOC126593392 isoform X3 [Malus sylvestris]|uniref:uncharacterized protein LOC126593392 isoform X3 n=1 Tax=Malus sylvestris TaxID=3752 RepID=UPI0021AC31F8|nr:uncharacterized protein LOC126593392 isoform X3 [Malus sylvestris]
MFGNELPAKTEENTVYNIGSAFDSTLISNMNIGYYQFCADSDSTLQKDTGTLFGTKLEVTLWWKSKSSYFPLYLAHYIIFPTLTRIISTTHLQATRIEYRVMVQ